MVGTARSIVFRAFLLGVATGMRSNMAGAALAWHQPDAPRRAGWKTWPVLRNVWGRRALMLAGAGELVGDKLPITPSRLEPRSVIGRLLFGALAGAAIGTEARGKRAVLRGAFAGMIGAGIGTFGGYYARKAVGEATGIPDPAIAMTEDAIAVTLATNAVANR